MREILLDIIRHTHGLGFLDTVKVIGTDKETAIESMASDRSVILKGSLNSPSKDLDGEFGMSRFNILSGFLNFANFKADDATLTIKRAKRDDKQVPEELQFKDSQGQSAIYRFMSADVIPAQAKFLGTTWDVSFEPTRSKFQEFSQLSGVLGSVENHFLVKVVDKQLRFYIGEEGSTSDKAFLIMDPAVEGELKTDLFWPISETLSILKLGLDENIKISFTSKGAMQIVMTSAEATYQYLLPAHKR
jgi:hypothetical protein